MNRRMMSLLLIPSMAGALLVAPAPAATTDSVLDALRARYVLSRIDVQNESSEGRIVKKGAVVILQGDGVPANRLRVVQINTKSPRFHVLDSARVEIGPDGHLTGGPGELTLAKGTRLVVLDLKTDGDRLRLFTHTVAPVRLADGKTAYGCTEFVFRLGDDGNAPGDLSSVTSRIDRWLELASEGQGGDLSCTC